MPTKLTDLCVIHFQTVAVIRYQYSQVVHQIAKKKKKKNSPCHMPKDLRATDIPVQL